MSKELALYLANEKVIARWQLANAIDIFELYPDSICANLVRLEYLEEEEYLRYVSQFYSVEIVDYEPLISVNKKILRVIPRDLVAPYKILPIAIHKNDLTVVFKPPIDSLLIRRLRLFTGFNIKPVITKYAHLSQALARFYSVEMLPIQIDQRLIKKYRKRSPMEEGDVSDVSAYTSSVSSAPDSIKVNVSRRRPTGSIKKQAVAEKVDAALSSIEGLSAEFEKDFDKEIEDKVNALLVTEKKRKTTKDVPAVQPEGDVDLPSGEDEIEVMSPQEELMRQSGIIESAEENVGADEESPSTEEPSPELEKPTESKKEEPPLEAKEVASKESSAARDEPKQADVGTESVEQPPTAKEGSSSSDDEVEVEIEQTLKDLNEKLTNATTRDEIINTSLDFLAPHAERLIFFVVKKKQASAFSARGIELPKEDLRKIEIDLNLISLVRAAVENLSPFVGEPFDDDVVSSLKDSIGGDMPKRVAVVPISIKEKPIGFIYMDDGGLGSKCDLDHGLANRVRKIVSAAFQTLILAKKLGV